MSNLQIILEWISLLIIGVSCLYILWWTGFFNVFRNLFRENNENSKDTKIKELQDENKKLRIENEENKYYIENLIKENKYLRKCLHEEYLNRLDIKKEIMNSSSKDRAIDYESIDCGSIPHYSIE